MATYTYKGTKITGTSTTAKKFPKSGITAAKKNQTYFNTETGHVYTCDTAGKPKDAKWKYTRTDIASAPSLKVNLKAPVRTTKGNNTRLMNATWTIPSGLSNEKNGDRAEGLRVEWLVGNKTVTKEFDGTNKKESTINLNSFKVGNKTYTRDSFYPANGKPTLDFVSVRVTPYNSKGDGVTTVEGRHFSKPKKPSIGGWSFNANTGTISCAITTDAGTGYAERYDTKYVVTIENTHTGKSWIYRNRADTDTSISVSYDASGYMNLGPNEYISIHVEAYARGYAGNSETVKSTYYISYPKRATIKSNILVSSKDSTGKCTVRLDTNSTTRHPVDQVRLGYLADVPYAKASDIPGETNWTWTDIVDDAECTALAMPVSDLIPSPGNHTWVCVKSYHAAESVLFVYSKFVEVKKLFTPAPTAEDDTVVIVDASAGADGESAVVQLAWDPDGTDDSTGTEISWSDELDTWKSTKEPDAHEFTWEDKLNGRPVPVTHEGTTYGHSATITIKGLNEGTKYYIKARRYLEGDTTTYSAYCDAADVITSEIPETIVASCDRYIPTGSSLQLSWTFAGNGIQRLWQVVDNNGTILLNGEGSTGSVQIPADRLSSFAVDNSVTFTVQASTGGDFVVSEPLTVTIIEPPTLAITDSSLQHVHEEETETYTGEIVEIDNDRDVLEVKSLSVSLEPIQSLNGYDKPWSGGGGKNKFDKEYLSNFANYTTTIGGYKYTDKIQLKPNTNYVITATNKTAMSSALYYVLYHVNGSDPDKITPDASEFLYPVYDGRVSQNDYYTNFTTGETGVIRFGVANATALAEIMSTDWQLEEGSTATAWTPYSNICPISGRTECNTYVSPTTSETDAEVYTTDLGRTVYGGDVEVVEGELIDRMGYIASYNGETIGEPWISDRDEYVAGTTPSIGAEVVYTLATPQTYQLTPTEVELLVGDNNVWSEGSIDLTTAEALVDGDYLRTNDLSIDFETNQLCDLIAIITSQGASGQFPQGIRRQTNGDTIHSDIYSPAWEETNDGLTGSVDFPPALDFWDGGRYTATVTAVDRQTGLKSEPATLEIPIAWLHQAPDPFDAVTLTPLDYMDDENDMHHQAVQIDLVPPTGAETNDLYDIYRMTGDGAQLIGGGFPLTCTAVDEYAPFGDDLTLYYRIATRTADGDVAFSDIEYNLGGNAMRFDWEGGTLELPYNLSIADSYEKDVDIRKHMDGSTDGYWNQNIERSGSLSSDAIRLEQQTDINAARQLARFPGAVFVRTPDGSAYEADVQVSDLSTEGAITAIAIDATEVGLTTEFILPSPYELEETEQEG